MTHAVSIDEEQRQLVLLALATLALERPGFDYALTNIALLIDNHRPDGAAEMYEGFKALNADRHAKERETMEALGESVKLQAHYAKLLNMHDGGERIAFDSAEQWIARLRELRGQK